MGKYNFCKLQRWIVLLLSMFAAESALINIKDNGYCYSCETEGSNSFDGWTLENVQYAISSVRKGSDSNVLVLLWMKDGKVWETKTYCSGVAARLEISGATTALDLICQFGLTKKDDCLAKIKNFIRDGEISDCINGVLNGLIVYLECVHELIPADVTVSKVDKVRTIARNQEKMSFSYGEATDDLPIDRVAVDSVINQ